MSGGSFNYACFKVVDEEVFNALEDVKDIERTLRDMSRHDEADEVYLFILLVETCRRRMAAAGQRISPLLQAVEWTCSGDWSEDVIGERFRELYEDNEEK